MSRIGGGPRVHVDTNPPPLPQTELVAAARRSGLPVSRTRAQLQAALVAVERAGAGATCALALLAESSVRAAMPLLAAAALTPPTPPQAVWRQCACRVVEPGRERLDAEGAPCIPANAYRIRPPATAATSAEHPNGGGRVSTDDKRGAACGVGYDSESSAAACANVPGGAGGEGTTTSLARDSGAQTRARSPGCTRAVSRPAAASPAGSDAADKQPAGGEEEEGATPAKRQRQSASTDGAGTASRALQAGSALSPSRGSAAAPVEEGRLVRGNLTAALLRAVDAMKRCGNMLAPSSPPPAGLRATRLLTCLLGATGPHANSPSAISCSGSLGWRNAPSCTRASRGT